MDGIFGYLFLRIYPMVVALSRAQSILSANTIPFCDVKDRNGKLQFEFRTKSMAAFMLSTHAQAIMFCLRSADKFN